MDLPKIFTCNICSKNYKHRQSLWNHNKKFHSTNEPKNNINEHYSKNIEPKNNIKSDITNKGGKPQCSYKCKYCNKEYKFPQSKNRHQNKCKNDLKTINIKLEEKCIKLENEVNEIKNQMLELMNKNCKMHPKTLQKINNQMNNCNITNINIVQLGNENIMETLSKKEKLKILSHCYGSFDKLIECVHFNPKYPQFKNIAITNLKDDYAYKYDEQQNKFIACKKEELLEDLLDNRVIDLEEILDENIEHINNVKVSKLKELIDKLYDKETLYNTKKSDIKLLIYNKCDTNVINV